MTADSPIDRRTFLKAGAASVGAAAVFLGAPGLQPLFGDRLHALRGVPADRVLVVVQLSGGNDGLSTVVPHADDAYHAARRATRQQQVLKLDDHVGLNTNLGGLKSLWDDGALAIVQGCSYPKPNRSHFESMDVWHSGDLAGGSQPYGWLGRFADAHLGKDADASALVGIGKTAERALVGKRVKPIALTDPRAYRFVAREGQVETFDEINDPLAKKRGGESNLEFLRRASKDAKSTSYRIRRAAESYETPVAYGAGGLAGDLRTAAAIIAARLPTRVIYCTLGGFDTHVNQRAPHDNLMRQLDGALSAFQKDLVRSGHADRVITLVFSEFGRRVAENGSNGTDHGVAGPMFLVGKGVKGGAYGKHPSLEDLDAGDLKMTTDFRAVYATVLDGWMSGDAKGVLGLDAGRIPRLLSGD